MFNMFEFLYQRDLVCRPFTTEIKKRFGDKPITGAEIGVFTGRNAKNMLKHLPNITEISLIDPYKIYDEYEAHTKSGGQQAFYDQVKEKAHRKLSCYADKIVWCEESFGQRTLSKCLDFIYIDGNHAYDYVKRDIQTALNHMKPGGILGGHDYNLVGVNKAVSELLLEPYHRKTDWWIFI